MVLKAVVKEPWKHLCKMHFRRLKNVGFGNQEDILHSCFKNISSGAKQDILEKRF